MKVDLNSIYYALPPDFMQKREGKTLLIWSFIPYWMVVSEQLLRVLTCFNGQRTLAEIIEQTVNMSRIPAPKYELLVKKKVANLLQARVLNDKPEKFAAPTLEGDKSYIDQLVIALSDEQHDDTLISPENLRNYLKSTFKYVKENSLLKIVGSKPITDITKLTMLIKAANMKGLNIVLDLPPDSYTPELLKDFTRARVQVQMTLDGVTPDLNDAVQGKGEYDKVLNTITNLVAKKIYTILNVNCSEHNYQEIPNFLKLAREYRVNECRIVPLKKMGKYKDFRIADYREILNYIADAIKKEPEFAKILGRDLFAVFEQLITQNDHKCNCGIGSKHLFLSVDGKVYPCEGCVCDKYVAGNINEESMEDIWEKSSVLNELRQKCSVDYSHQCMRCVIRYWCRGGCKAEVIRNGGSLDQPSLSCRSIQLTFIDLFWKLADEEETIKPKQAYC